MPLYLLQVMLPDSAHIQESDANFLNKKRVSEGKQPIKPLYTLNDVERSWPLFRTFDYNNKVKVEDDIQIEFFDAGHILGSSAIHMIINEGKHTKKITYTGDVGRYLNKILKAPAPFPQSDYIICESTYGNREHVSNKTALKELYNAVYETCYAKGGKLIIPAFSVGKTQELVYTLNKLEFDGKLPKLKVLVDSPLAINATEIFRRNENCFSESIEEFMRKDPDPFGFNHLHYTKEVQSSKAINYLKEPCIIISASGMAEAGRIKHHLANNIENPRNSILIIGYSEPSTLAGKLIAGDKKVSIYGRTYDVKADVYNIDFYSAHADKNELLRYLSCQEPMDVKGVFLVHGSKTASSELAKGVEKYGFYPVTINEIGMKYEL